jgi:hypothetical protein
MSPGVLEFVVMKIRIAIDRGKLAAFRRKWRISDLSFFGSVLRGDFSAKSDVDVLVGFAPGASWSLLDHVTMEQELSKILGRRADLVSRRAVERSKNWIRREAILASAMPAHAGRS